MVRSKEERDDSSFHPHASVASDWLDAPDFSGFEHWRGSIDESLLGHGVVGSDKDAAAATASVARSHYDNNKNMSTVSSVTTTRAADVEALSMNVEKTTQRTWLMAFLVVLIGAAASSAFLALGITSAQQTASDSFQQRALKVATEIEKSWQDYDMAALWIHNACREWRTNNYTRDDFGLLYHYIRSLPLEFYGMNWVPNVTHDERAAMEQEGKTGWLLSAEEEEDEEEWRDKGVYDDAIPYSGFMGMEPDPKIPGELVFTKRSEQPWYFPIHVSTKDYQDRKPRWYNASKQHTSRSPIVTM